MADTQTQGARAAKPARSETRETLVFLVKLAVVVFLFRSFVIAPYSIPSQSMLPRLYVGDYLFVSKWNYGYSRWSFPWGLPLLPGRVLGRSPARGDVVVFRGPKGDDNDIIKRVIGLPGDTIQMKKGQLFLNGQPVPKVPVADFTIPISPNYDAQTPLDDGCQAQFRDVLNGQPICRYKQFRETLPDGKSYNVLDRGDDPEKDDTAVYTVPKGTVFLMGDNRDDSADSRWPAPADALPGQAAGMGFIPMERIEGKAMVNFWSTDGSANWVLPWTWVSAARWKRIGMGF